MANQKRSTFYLQNIRVTLNIFFSKFSRALNKNMKSDFKIESEGNFGKLLEVTECEYQIRLKILKISDSM